MPPPPQEGTARTGAHLEILHKNSPFWLPSVVGNRYDCCAHERIVQRESAMKAVAIKKGQIEEGQSDFMEMGTLRCDSCGEEFTILHNPAFPDKNAAERQAHWLERVLADEHERERKHPNRIQLPD
jgi:hypothetical protein